MTKGYMQVSKLTRQAVEGAGSSKDAAKALSYDIADAAAQALHNKSMSLFLPCIV